MARKSRTRTAPAAPVPAREEPVSLWRWLDALPAIWLAVVISAYALLALYPMVATKREVPGIAEAERFYWPLLLGLVLAAIMRYRFLPPEPVANAAPATPEEGHNRA